MYLLFILTEGKKGISHSIFFCTNSTFALIYTKRDSIHESLLFVVYIYFFNTAYSHVYVCVCVFHNMQTFIYSYNSLIFLGGIHAIHCLYMYECIINNRTRLLIFFLVFLYWILIFCVFFFNFKPKQKLK